MCLVLWIFLYCILLFVHLEVFYWLMMRKFQKTLQIKYVLHLAVYGYNVKKWHSAKLDNKILRNWNIQATLELPNLVFIFSLMLSFLEHTN